MISYTNENIQGKRRVNGGEAPSASGGKDDMVKLLLEAGANKELENLDRFKAIDLACTPKIYKMLRG